MGEPDRFISCDVDHFPIVFHTYLEHLCDPSAHVDSCSGVIGYTRATSKSSQYTIPTLGHRVASEVKHYISPDMGQLYMGHSNVINIMLYGHHKGAGELEPSAIHMHTVRL